MEAEETVMSIDGLLQSKVNFNKPMAVWLKQSLKAQAEITWKARDGEVEAAKVQGLEAGLEQGKMEGIKEVVDWLGNHPHILHSYHIEEWQVKLKEWGY